MADRGAEAHLERPQHPDDEHDREGGERQHHAVDRPALLHDAAVQDDEAGNAHQTDERRGCHLPSVVSALSQVGWVSNSMNLLVLGTGRLTPTSAGGGRAQWPNCGANVPPGGRPPAMALGPAITGEPLDIGINAPRIQRETLRRAIERAVRAPRPRMDQRAPDGAPRAARSATGLPCGSDEHRAAGRVQLRARGAAERDPARRARRSASRRRSGRSAARPAPTIVGAELAGERRRRLLRGGVAIRRRRRRSSRSSRPGRSAGRPRRPRPRPARPRAGAAPRSRARRARGRPVVGAEHDQRRALASRRACRGPRRSTR